jgi:hypothetical protein
MSLVAIKELVPEPFQPTFWNQIQKRLYQLCDSYGVLGDRPINATESKGEKLSI